jgi:methionyl-tRNA formyltransferase
VEKKNILRIQMNRVLVIGAVKSTAITIIKLLEHKFNVVGILGHEPNNSDLVSGWVDLKCLALDNGIDYLGFRKINNSSNLNWAAEKLPDIIFAVGFSQLLGAEWLQLPKLGCIGFHPTNLPEGRGRAPLAWITLDKMMGSASFFLMGEGSDDGPIFTQSFFEVVESDDAGSVENKIGIHMNIALDKWLQDLKKGIWNPEPQDHSKASWYGKRGPEDGWINWNNSAIYLNRLVKASSFPHPGAYTYFNDKKVKVWKSDVENDIKIKGTVGRVLLKNNDKGDLIQCGDGLLWIQEIEIESGGLLKVGDKLGFNLEDEIYMLKKKINNEE